VRRRRGLLQERRKAAALLLLVTGLVARCVMVLIGGYKVTCGFSGRQGGLVRTEVSMQHSWMGHLQLLCCSWVLFLLQPTGPRSDC
jgi:hypothetical protein